MATPQNTTPSTLPEFLAAQSRAKALGIKAHQLEIEVKILKGRIKNRSRSRIERFRLLNERLKSEIVRLEKLLWAMLGHNALPRSTQQGKLTENRMDEAVHRFYGKA